MAKTKTSTNTAETIDSAFSTGTDAMKDGFEKAVKGYDRLVAFSKDNTDAFVRSANVAGKALETINSEVLSFSRERMETGVAAAKAIFGAKSVNEAIELQADYGRAAIEAYVAELSKLSDLALSTAKTAAEPLSARVSAFAELVQGESEAA